MPFRLSRTTVLAALLCATLLPVTMLARQGAQPQEGAARPTGVSATTTLNDQVDLSLTVYNSNLALIRDIRQLTLPSGGSTLKFADVAAAINPATVRFRSLTEPVALTVLEQNYEYDLLEPEKLLRKYVGREITIVRDRQEGGATRAEEVKALLLAYNNGPVWKIGNEIVTGLRVDQYRFPELPENLFSHPTLVWMLENGGSARHRVEASYLSGGFSWNADYVLTIGRDDKVADLAGWVTLKNQSGTSYRNARLQLIAGEVNRVSGDTIEREAGIARKIGMVAQAPAMQFYYRNQQSPGSPIKSDVKVYYRFKNDERAGLGIPMPAGVVRVYQADSKGGAQFAGEDRMAHTPKDEALNLHTGNAFDIVCERKQVDFKRLSNSLYEMEFEITLRNHKDSAVTIEANEPIGGDWDMLTASHKWTKTDASAARFEVPVAKDGTAVLRYRIRSVAPVAGRDLGR